MRSRRVFVAILAVSVLILGAVACSASGSSSAPTRPNEAPPAAQSRSFGAAASPASAAAPAPTAAAKSASAPAAPAAAAKPAADAAGRQASEAAKPAAAAGAPAAPVAQAQPPRPAPPAPTAGPAGIVPPPAPKPSEPADPAAVMQAQPGRMVIFTTELSMLVANPAQMVNSLSDIVNQAGGYVAGVESKDEGGIPVTAIRLKFPPGTYDATMRRIRDLAVEVTAEKATTQDVTEEFSDVQTQLASLEASHARLLELMSKAQNMDEILKIQRELSQIKIQIDRLKGRETFLQRSAEFATVTVNVRPAEDVLARTFSTLRSTLRRAEAQRAQTVIAVQRAKTPEEEASLRDRLGEITLEIERLTARIADINTKATTAGITLPQPAQEDSTLTAMTDEEMLREYLRLAVEHRQAEAERDRLNRELKQNATVENVLLMQNALVRVQTLDTQKKAMEERARRASVTLPPLTADQIATLAGVQPEPVAQPGPVALVVLGVLVLLGIAALVVGRLRRRPPAAPHPTPAR